MNGDHRAPAAVHCPLCGSSSQPGFRTTDRNRRVDATTFQYRRCEGCQVTYLANPPEDLARYYASDYHRLPTAADLDASAGREAYKVQMLREYLPEGRIVDIGPSFGGFPYLARRAGYEVTAIEIDEACCSFIESVVKARAIHSGEPERILAEMSDLDAVTLWHSIEHLAEPWLTVRNAIEALRPGGVLIVATPNPEGFEARLLGPRWVHVDAPRHLFLIPAGALAARATAWGVEMVRWTAEDEEARRCNVLGWHHALRDLGMRGPVTPLLAHGIERVLRPLERRAAAGSVYTSIFVKAA